MKGAVVIILIMQTNAIETNWFSLFWDWRKKEYPRLLILPEIKWLAAFSRESKWEWVVFEIFIEELYPK